MTAIIIASYILIWLPTGSTELSMGPAYQNEQVCERAAMEVGKHAPAAWCIPGPDKKQSSPNAVIGAPRRDDGADRRRRRTFRKKLLSDDDQQPLFRRVAAEP